MTLRITATLIATIVIEYGVLLALGERRKRVLLGSVVMNILTNVPLNLYANHTEWTFGKLIAGETIVVLLEAGGYFWLVGNKTTALVYSCLCNAISYLTGLLVQLTSYYLL